MQTPEYVKELILHCHTLCSLLAIIQLSLQLLLPLGLTSTLLGSSRRSLLADGLLVAQTTADTLVQGFSGIVARRTAAIWNVEQAIEAAQSISKGADDFHKVDEAVVASFAMEPGRFICWPRIKRCSCAKGRTESEERSGKDDDKGLGPQTTGAAAAKGVSRL